MPREKHYQQQQQASCRVADKKNYLIVSIMTFAKKKHKNYVAGIKMSE